MSGPAIPVGLSASSVFPEPVEYAFELAARLGYDGVEILVTAERATQDPARLAELVAAHGIPVLSVHSPCLLVTARVWGTDPIEKAARSVDMARELGARTVVVHPPFVWQRSAAHVFPQEIAALSDGSDVRVAVENMFPLKVLRSVVNAYRPHWNPVPAGYPWYTLDLSHAAASGVDALALAQQMGTHLAHVHLCDGSGAPRDEHLVPGRGIAPAGAVLESLAGRGPSRYDGAVVLEVSTRNATAEQREADLAEALAFARLYLGQ